ncbi:MAG: hypothetical protein KGL70_05105 [Betaproteobacteria bacterium]|nr:hypothetical protein [Betaproteobacteria bacterium]MDE2004129.1 hypothetical protein [Betaproteobacteria bacterium]MDE2209994.1 hypothetical protein [Betaproteobacteria bacterium]MDE2358745.1 hypothetical protein [Betaproteobacteria bacterium]
MIRKLRTRVYFDFSEVDGERKSLTLRNPGHGQGEDWMRAKAHFASAWPEVMASLEKRYAKP